MTISRSEADRVFPIVAAVIEDPAGPHAARSQSGRPVFHASRRQAGPGRKRFGCTGRELFEELGCRLAGEPELLGEYIAPAANEPGHIVQAMIPDACLAGTPAACAEIADPRHDPRIESRFFLSLLARDHVLPAAVARRGEV